MKVLREKKESRGRQESILNYRFGLCLSYLKLSKENYQDLYRMERRRRAAKPRLSGKLTTHKLGEIGVKME